MLTGILLAAGNSQRFGSPKLLHHLEAGLTLALKSAFALQPAVDYTVIVVRSQTDPVATQFHNTNFIILPCPKSSQGLGNSLACGITATLNSTAWLIALADMPFIQPDTYQAIASLMRQGTLLAAPSYQGKLGHPIGFHRQFAPQLQALTGDQGARHLLQKYQSQLQIVATQDPGIHWDIDHPKDLLSPKPHSPQ